MELNNIKWNKTDKVLILQTYNYFRNDIYHKKCYNVRISQPVYRNYKGSHYPGAELTYKHIQIIIVSCRPVFVSTLSLAPPELWQSRRSGRADRRFGGGFTTLRLCSQKEHLRKQFLLGVRNTLLQVFANSIFANNIYDIYNII